MSIDAIPVFKPNQALTARHLNDLRTFLDQQDRLTRRSLIGIGILCGFELDLDANAHLHISDGVAVTSEGHVITEEAVICDRVRDYTLPLPSGDGITPEQVAEARYPFLFPDGENSIEAWELLTTDAEVPADAAPPDALTAAFLADKSVMLFLECVEQSLKNCDINDCADKGAELQFTLRRLLVRRADADAMIARETEIAGFPTDPATHPQLALKTLRVEDLGLARHAIGTYPALFARILQIALRLATELPQALRDAWAAYQHLLVEMFPADRFPDGPFPDDYFGNVWGNLAVQPFQVLYFYDYMLDAVLAYNAFIERARAFSAECLPDPNRFPKHVLLGDPLPRPTGFVAEVSTPADFAGYDPLAASTGFGPRPNAPLRRTPWTPAETGTALADLRAAFHRLTLLAHAFELRGLLDEEIRITPSRHGAAPLGQRCIPHYYRFNVSSDLFRVWSPEKTRANLLSTVYSHRFSARDGNHPYLYRIDGEDFYYVAGHVGKNLAQVMRELIEHKRVLGLDFAIEPVWMGLALTNDPQSLAVDNSSYSRAFEAARRLIACRMGDFEVILLTILAALFAFLTYILRGVGRQRTVDFTRPPRLAAVGERVAAGDTVGGAIGRELAAADMARLAALARIDAVRRPELATFTATRIRPQEREEVRILSRNLLDRFRATPPRKGAAAETLVVDADNETTARFYLAVQNDSSGSLFDRVRRHAADSGLDLTPPGALDRVMTTIGLMDATEALMDKASAPSLADFDADGFETAYVEFSDQLSAYAAAAPTDPADVDEQAAATNLAIADYAPAVAAQSTALGGAGLLGEARRRMEAIFADLTLEGFARRHPGLEHRAGVGRDKTLVLAYVSRRELLQLMRTAAARLDEVAATMRFTNAVGSFNATIVAAVDELLSSAGPQTDDPLSEFVVLGDFCLDSQCCDSDCSDVLLEDSGTGGLFDLKTPGTMGVDPIIPNGVPGGTPSPPAPLPGIDNERLGALLGAIGVADARIAAPLAGRRRRPAARQPIVDADPDTPVPEPGGTPPARPTPERPVIAQPTEPRPTRRQPRRRAEGTLNGRVTGSGSARNRLIPNARVFAVNEATGERIRSDAPGGVFSMRLPPGRFRVTAEAPNFEGVSRTVEIGPDTETTADLRMRRRR